MSNSSVRPAITRRGFTIVELLVIIAVIAVLSVVLIVSYVGVQRRTSSSLVQNTIADANKKLQVFFVFNKNYPSNIADTEYAPPLSVAVALFTDAAQRPVYSNLTSDQNAQLFLNACNGFMPVVDGGTTYNNSCVYNGNNAHIKGTSASNIVIQGPVIKQADFVLICGSACDMAQSSIISEFVAQGGTFLITVPKSGSPLPSPTMVNTGAATRYCIEGRSADYSDIIYHALPDSEKPIEGPCPADPGLHYP